MHIICVILLYTYIFVAVCIQIISEHISKCFKWTMCMSMNSSLLMIMLMFINYFIHGAGAMFINKYMCWYCNIPCTPYYFVVIVWIYVIWRIILWPDNYLILVDRDIVDTIILSSWHVIWMCVDLQFSLVLFFHVFVY